MTEAKVPDKKSDWKSLDIFLFSNGQESSPPRKYHLETNQLTWWNLTLNYLARAHFGHSEIDLYTIEGQKVETPMQLCHGAAYVAVQPPAHFIDAGYGNYLIKASRSWEKGQARRDSQTILSQSDNIKIKADESSLETILQNSNADPNKIVSSTADNITSDLVKLKLAGNKQMNNKQLRGIPTKASDKRKPHLNNPVTPRKISSTTSPPTAKKSSIKRKDSVKINANIKNETSIRGSNNFLSKVKKTGTTEPDVVLSKVEEVVTELKSSSSNKQIDDNSITSAKISEEKSFIQDKETSVASSVHRNIRTSLQPSILLDPRALLLDNSKTKSLVTELFRDNHHHENKHAKEENKLDVLVTNIPMKPMKLNTLQECLTGTEVLSSPKTTENNAETNIDEFKKEDPVKLNALEGCFTGTEMLSSPKTPYNSKDQEFNLINKEGIVNLKLHIEIQNARCDHKAHTEPMFKANSQKIYIEKGSQVCIEEKIEEHDNLHELICSKLAANEIGGNPKVSLVKCTCTCQGGDNCSVNTIPIHIGNSKFVIILPLSNSGERLRSNFSNEQDQVQRVSTTSNPVKKTISCCSLLNNETAITSSTNSQDLKDDQRELSIMQHKSVAIKESQNICPEPKAEESVRFCNSNIILDTPTSSTLKKESIHQFKTMDKFTQTELCGMILEARLSDEGHYSFHVPSLKTLKHFKF